LVPYPPGADSTGPVEEHTNVTNVPFGSEPLAVAASLDVYTGAPPSVNVANGPVLELGVAVVATGCKIVPPQAGIELPSTL
jgi:hypothetical protein